MDALPRLVFFSDFICPWCYIAELGALRPLRARYALDFEWYGFELHPDLPPGGRSLADVFPNAQIQATHRQLANVARDFGVTFTPRMHMPSTRPAFAIAALARKEGVLDAWRSHVMEAYWEDGRDLEDRDVLGELAQASGLDADAAVSFVDDPRVDRILKKQREQAYLWGVTGIPTWFVLPAQWEPGDARPPAGRPQPSKVVGCQPLAVLEEAARKAGAVPSSSPRGR